MPGKVIVDDGQTVTEALGLANAEGLGTPIFGGRFTTGGVVSVRLSSRSNDPMPDGVLVSAGNVLAAGKIGWFECAAPGRATMTGFT